MRLGALFLTQKCIILGTEFSFKSCIYLRCFQHQVNLMTLDAPKTVFERQFGTLS